MYWVIIILEIVVDERRIDQRGVWDVRVGEKTGFGMGRTLG